MSTCHVGQPCRVVQSQRVHALQIPHNERQLISTMLIACTRYSI
jgi:hypothetical protein